MKKILVTTDLSHNSKAAVRFAIQLASQGAYKLVFYHTDTSFSVDPWVAVTFADIPEPDNKVVDLKLRNFIKMIYRQTGKTPGEVNYIAENRPDVTNAIINCSKKINADYICISTRGGGLIDKLIGSHTSKILREAQVPVFVVPKYYRRIPLNTILYPSDIENIETELQIVKRFAASFDGKISVYHYYYFTQEKQVRNSLNKIKHQFESDKIAFHFKKVHAKRSLLRYLHIDIILAKPSIITFFTRKDINLFENIFKRVTTAEKGFDTKTPMLVFKKQ